MPVRTVSISSPDQLCMMPLLKSMVRMKSRVSCLSKDRLYIIKKRIADIISQNRGKLMATPPGSWAWWKGVNELSQWHRAYWGNFQRKEGGEFMWSCWQISLASGSIWKPYTFMSKARLLSSIPSRCLGALLRRFFVTSSRGLWSVLTVTWRPKANWCHFSKAKTTTNISFLALQYLRAII